MRGIPSKEKVAGIIWAECAGIQASASTITSRDTYLHRFAIGVCVVNRGWQNLDWDDNRQTCAPAPSPTASDLANPNVQQQWTETQRAASAAMATWGGSMNCAGNLFGAQLYVHTWTGPHTGMRLGGRFVASYQAWDTRCSGPVWLSVHVIERMRDNAIAQWSTGVPRL